MRVKFLRIKQHTALKTTTSSLSSKISPSKWKSSCNSKANNNDPKSAILNLGGKCARVGMEPDRVSQVENTVPFGTRTFRLFKPEILVEWNAQKVTFFNQQDSFLGRRHENARHAKCGYNLVLRITNIC